MTHTYPVNVTAELDPKLSRGLWLVKWILAIPHYLILLGLWLAFAVLSIVAFFAIVFTGRYPRAIFDFNVGVMRWTWRVTYYAYGALATDRYPPFTLADVADYPAHLDVAYPERLSRGLVLVKWWLLALPHYLVVAFFVGGGLYAMDETSQNSSPLLLGGGLIGLLALVAAVVLLFTGRYPRTIFDLVIGLQRWTIRVVAYAALMTDEYPLFRLDQGGGTAPQVDGSPAPVASPSRASTGSTGSTGSIVAGVVSLSVAGLLLLGAGSFIAAQHAMPDDDGFFMTPGWSVNESTYAITSESINIPSNTLGGMAPGVMPRHSNIWIAHSESSGLQSLTWPMRSGDWTVVVMRSDGDQGIAADVEAGATLPAVGWIVTGLLVGTGVFLLIGLAFLIGGLKSRTPRSVTVRP